MKEQPLDSKVFNVNGHFERHTWLSGTYDDLGEIVQGWSGAETLIKRTIIKPIVIFEVKAGE